MTNNVPAPAPLLRIEGLKKRFGDREVLRGIDLDVAAGEAVVLLGPNGCGKSTLLRCLNLLERYQGGRVWLDGAVVSEGRAEGAALTEGEDADAQRLRQRMGMVFQRFNLFPHMNVEQNVASGPRYGLGLPAAEAHDRARKMLDKVGLLDKAPLNPLTLSGGQQQRVAIARALAMRPEVMLFDEATSALDPLMTQEVLKVMRALAGEGMTMLVVTHDMGLARSLGERVVFMQDGVIDAQGTPGHILDERPTEHIRAFLQR